MAKTAAPWWDDPNAQDTPVVAHTPDPRSYHYPDERQLDRMRHGIMGVVIPRARNDGTSMGFDGRHAGVVHVDPDAPDGGVVVDLSHLNRRDYNEAFRHSHFPHEVFYQIGDAPADLGVSAERAPDREELRQRTNSMVPAGSYIVPKSRNDGRQIQEEPIYQEETMAKKRAAVPPMPSQAMSPMAFTQPVSTNASPSYPTPLAQPPQFQQQPQQPQQPQYQQPQYQQPYYPPVPSGPSPEIQQMQAMMGQLAQAVGQIAQNQRAVPPLPRLADEDEGQELRTMPRSRPPQREDGRSRRRPGRSLPQPSDPEYLRQRVHKMRKRPQADEETDEDYTPQFAIGQRPDGKPSKAGHRPERQHDRPNKPGKPGKRQTVRQVQEAAEREDDRGVIMGFESLKCAAITGPMAEKPKYEVYFEIPKMGVIQARYHAVREGSDNLMLVYDSRYEDGQRYLPPDLGADVPVQVTVKIGKKTRSYTCGLLGSHNRWGVFDFAFLTIRDDAVEQTVSEEEELEGDED